MGRCTGCHDIIEINVENGIKQHVLNESSSYKETKVLPHQIKNSCRRHVIVDQVLTSVDIGEEKHL